MPDYAAIALDAARTALSILRGKEERPHDSPELLDELVDSVHELAYAVNERLQSEEDPLRVHLPVCRDGCAWCCYADVIAYAPEVLRIARYLRSTQKPEELSALRARLRELASRTRDMTTDDWKKERIPCPMLDVESASCTVHEVRPGLCRAYNSLNVAQCIQSFEAGDGSVPVPSNRVQQSSIQAAGIGLVAACRASGLEWEGLSLTAGLAAALETPEAPEAWLAGERPLHEAETRASRGWKALYTADVDRTLRALQAEGGGLPPRPAAAPSQMADDLSRRERNRKKRQRQTRRPR
jgi:Fe-S-cluster containining protein